MRMARVARFAVAVAVIGLLTAMWTGCSRDPEVRKQKDLESGERYFDKGQYREADIQFRNAIQVNDKFAEAHYRLGLTALKLEQWKRRRNCSRITIRHGWNWQTWKSWDGGMPTRKSSWMCW